MSVPSQVRILQGADASIALAILRRVAFKELSKLGSTGDAPKGTWQTDGIQDVDGQWYVLTCRVEGHFLIVTDGRKRKPKPWQNKTKG